MKDLKDLLIYKRLSKSTVSRSAPINEFYSDRSRIIYCSSFRRLQQKAQVFSLEPNASVRTRMTHSLEVADIGRTLANEIAYELCRKELLSSCKVPSIVTIVENACLLHDIGNPPFGHFGEIAIQDWAKENIKILAKGLGIPKNGNFEKLMSDFYEFDGNPQGFRAVTKLHAERDEYGLNLTYATLMCSLKYVRAAGEKCGKSITKKAGYFQTEKSLVESIYNEMEMDLHTRYPLTYIMEAADDISYCLSDISDGIEKRIITINDFIDGFKEIWRKDYPSEKCPVKIPKMKDIYNFSLSIAIPWSKQAINDAANNFIDNYSEFLCGKADQLIPCDGMGKVLETIKQFSRTRLYTSLEAESIELTGYAVMTGILRHFQRLLVLPHDKFEKLLSHNVRPSELAYEIRLFNQLGNRCVKSYNFELDKIKGDKKFTVIEWWLRVHLLIDHISGMTDEFALQTYQMLEGIELLRI